MNALDVSPHLSQLVPARFADYEGPDPWSSGASRAYAESPEVNAKRPDYETAPSEHLVRILTLRPTLLILARFLVIVVTGSLAVALAVQINRYERDFVTLALDWKSISIVVSFVAVLTSAMAMASRRFLASLAFACAFLVLLTTASVYKFHYLRASLYALDFYYYARPTEIVFLYKQFPTIFFTGLAAIIAFLLITGLLLTIDDSRIPRRISVLLLTVAMLSLSASYYWRGQRSKVYHFNGLYHVSAALASAPEAFDIFYRGGFLEGADRGGKIDSTPLKTTQSSQPNTAPPTILFILHESTFPTSLFPIQCGGPSPNALYTSSNGKKYELRVETYGGATWLTEYGLLLGISTYYFGEARSFIGYTMENRVFDSLPLQLHRDGYQSVALYPSQRRFVNTGPFYKSIGFDKVVDYYDMHATSEHERDRFYFGKAIEQIRAHNASGSKDPLFIFIWTMATHAPYTNTLFPDVPPKPDAICAKSKSWSEYIRRLLLAETDLAWLHQTLKTEFPDKPFMILGYGDHQPFISRDFLDTNLFDKQNNAIIPTRNSLGYTTFFRLTGVNFEPDWSAVPASVDTPFLGNVVMRAARLPRHGFYNDRDKLLELCHGRYNDCPHQDEILSFHERMIKSATIVNH